MQVICAHDRQAPPSEVPLALLEHSCGHDDRDEFLRSGAEIKTMFDLALRRHLGTSIEACRRVLDFGCGCGRVLRHVRAAEVFACDTHAACVAYCNATLPHTSCYQNGEVPPLVYRDEAFDLVYAFAVFSGFSLDREMLWLAELVRVGTPSCAYLISVQGDWIIEHLGPERAAADKAGFYMSRGPGGRIRRNGPPSWREVSYHTSEYVRREWARHFDILAVVKGDDPGRYLGCGEAFMPEGSVPWFRPMGEDLVVARKRPS